MPHAKPDELPSGGGGRWPAAGDNFRSVQWGDMEVGYTTAGPLDCTQLYRLGGLPGEVYFFPAGHVLIYPGPTRALELNPAFALQQCMDAMAKAGQKMTTAPQQDS